MGVPKTSAPPLCREPTRTIRSEIVQEFSRSAVKDLRAYRHSYRLILTVSTLAIRTFTVPATIGNVFRVITKVKQSVE